MLDFIFSSMFQHLKNFFCLSLSFCAAVLLYCTVQLNSSIKSIYWVSNFNHFSFSEITWLFFKYDWPFYSLLFFIYFIVPLFFKSIINILILYILYDNFNVWNVYLFDMSYVFPVAIYSSVSWFWLIVLLRV